MKKRLLRFLDKITNPPVITKVKPNVQYYKAVARNERAAEHFLTVFDGNVLASLHGLTIINGKIVSITNTPNGYEVEFWNTRVYDIFKY